MRWLREARRVLKPDGTLWVSGTHHIIFSLGFALQRLEFRVINNVVWSKPNPTPNALHTAFTHAHETLIWASKSRSSRHTFNYDLINSPNSEGQLTAVAAKELGRFFVGTELEREYCELASRRIQATKRGCVLREIRLLATGGGSRS